MADIRLSRRAFAGFPLHLRPAGIVGEPAKSLGLARSTRVQRDQARKD